MATFQYTQIADFVAEQLWSFVNANLLNHSIRYIAEDILGNPASNSDMIPALTMNGSSDGGRINFNGGTSQYLIANSTYFSIEGADFTLDSPAIMKGSRQFMTFNNELATGSGVRVYLTQRDTTSGVDQGFYAPANGSILSFAVEYDVISYSVTGTFDIAFYKNGSSLLALATQTVSANGVVGASTSQQARGGSTFAIGDRLECSMIKNSGTYNAYVAAIADIVYDS